jgi:hypothetical protein
VGTGPAAVWRWRALPSVPSTGQQEGGKERGRERERERKSQEREGEETEGGSTEGDGAGARVAKKGT